ncbi:MAG TPA: MBL fold metallo-hydrolase [Geobacteraceae bacterium]
MRQHTVHTPYMVGEAHFYSTEIDGNLVLFDTGPATPDALARLREGVDISRLKYVFITHCHVDHYGLAAVLSQQCAAEILLPSKDAVKFRRHGERLAHIERLLTECGFDAAFIRGFRSIVENSEIFPKPPGRFTIVEESGIPEKLGISRLSCPGHSQSDLVYRHGDWAITGDVLLRNIFQAPLLDVDLETFNGRFRNYDAYCTSLLELAKLRGCTVLPGHRDYVESVDDTIVSYVRKMLERAGQVKRCAGVESIRDVVDQLFKETFANPFFVYLKVSEIVFMRDLLADPERLARSLRRIGLFDAVNDLYGVVAA